MQAELWRLQAKGQMFQLSQTQAAHHIFCWQAVTGKLPQLHKQVEGISTFLAVNDSKQHQSALVIIHIQDLYNAESNSTHIEINLKRNSALRTVHATRDLFQRHTYDLLAMLLDSQSRPSYSPSPDVAQVLWMYLQETVTQILRHS